MAFEELEKPKLAAQDLNQTISTFSSLCRPRIKPFDLTDIENCRELRDDTKYRQFLSYLRSYNKLSQQNPKREVCIIQKKLHQFLYSSLCICNAKTKSQAKVYLEEIDKWYQSYSKKRNFVLKYKNKTSSSVEDECIRQTYKSNLPMEIQQYARHPFGLTIKKNTQQPKNSKNKIGFEVLDNDNDQNSVLSLQSDQEDIPEKKNSLPNLREYKMQILRMRKAMEDKQDKMMIEQLKKNKARLHAQTANNFYKPFPRYTGVTLKPVNSSIKENKLPNCYDTSTGFNLVKKRRLNNTLGLKTLFRQQNFSQAQVDNVDGLNLIRNPFEVVKPKGKKKK